MLEKIRDIIEERFDFDRNAITEDTSLRDELGADSLDLLEMVMCLEDEYNLEIDIEEEMDHIKTIGDVLNFLKSRGVE